MLTGSAPASPARRRATAHLPTACVRLAAMLPGRMTLWIRYDHAGQSGFGTLEGTAIAVHEGSPFADPRPTGATLDLAGVSLRRPCEPTKMVALWNNFRALAAKLGQQVPPEPLYFLKNPASFADPGVTIRRPASYDGKVVYEGGTRHRDRPSPSTTPATRRPRRRSSAIPASTTSPAADVLGRDPTFAQWTRAKGYAGFGPFGAGHCHGARPRHARRAHGARRRRAPELSRSPTWCSPPPNSSPASRATCRC